MINIGDKEITIMLGNAEIPAIYCGDLQIYPSDFGTLTGITIDNLTWIKDVPYTGGTASSANCSFYVTAYYDSGKTRKVTGKSTITGSMAVPATTIESRQYIGDLTLTASYEGFSDSATIGVYQEAYSPCNPIILVNNLGNTNNQNYNKSGFYTFDSGITEITPCEYDFTGIVCICSRDDSFYSTPNAFLGKSNGGMPTSSDGCLRTIENVEIDCSTVTSIVYPFGNDSPSQFSQSLTSVTLTNTDNVISIKQLFKYCGNLVSVSIGSFANVTSASDGQFSSTNTQLTDISIDALPAMNITNWGFDQLPSLTEQSVINILNALPTGNYTLTIGSVNKNKLTSAEGQTALANAQNKGWTVN